MIVRCPKCNSESVTLRTELDVEFEFDVHGDVHVVTDVEDEIYWGVEYNGLEATGFCPSCNNVFQYKGAVKDD